MAREKKQVQGKDGGEKFGRALADSISEVSLVASRRGEALKRVQGSTGLRKTLILGKKTWVKIHDF